MQQNNENNWLLRCKAFLQNFLHIYVQVLQKTLRSDFTQKITITFFSQLVIIGIGLLSSIIISRTLGPASRGILALASTLTVLGVQLGNLGLHSSNTYLLAKDRSLLSAIAGNSLLAGLGVGIFIASILLAFFSFQPQWAPIEKPVLVLALLGIPASLLYLLFQNILLGIQNVKTYNILEIINKSLYLFLCLVFIFLNSANVKTILTINLLISTSCALYIIIKTTKSFSVSTKLLKLSSAFGLKVFISCLLSFIVLKSDILIMRYFLNFEQIGFYATAKNIIEMMSLLPSVIGTLLFPKLSSLDNETLKLKYTHKVVIVSLFFVLFFSLAASLLGKSLISVFFGKNFLPVYPVLLWLLPHFIICSINSVYQNYFASIGMPPIALYSPLSAAGLSVLLNIFLIPRFGIIGASISSGLCNCLMLVLSLAFVQSGKRKITLGKHEPAQ